MIDIKVTEKNFKFKLNKEALGKYMGIYFPEETQFLDILEVQMKKLENSTPEEKHELMVSVVQTLKFLIENDRKSP